MRAFVCCLMFAFVVPLVWYTTTVDAQTAQTGDPNAPVVTVVAAPDVDLAWETRRVPYLGGPIRPGAQLDARHGPLVGWGAAALVVGYVLNLAVLYDVPNDQYGDRRPYALIPLVGSWFAATNAFGGDLWSDGLTGLMIVNGVLQAGGLLFLVIGLMTPEQELVFDAPVGQPSPFDSYQVSLVPSAPGADIGGLSLRVTGIL